MASHILVTAFEPFGIIRGYVPGLRGNRSQDLLERLQEETTGDSRLKFQLLPVEVRCCEVLQMRLAEAPAGVVLMGEDLSCTLRLETKARDPSVQVGLLPLPGADWRTSTFASGLVDRMRQAGASTSSGIGTYHCNRIYWHALEWASQAGGRPVVFLHVGPFASINWQLAQVRDVIQQMQQAPAD